MRQFERTVVAAGALLAAVAAHAQDNFPTKPIGHTFMANSAQVQ